MNETNDDLNDRDPIDYCRLFDFGFGEGVNDCGLALDIGCGFFVAAYEGVLWDIQTIDDGDREFYSHDIPTPHTYGELRRLLRVLGVEPKA